MFFYFLMFFMSTCNIYNSIYLFYFYKNKCIINGNMSFFSFLSNWLFCVHQTLIGVKTALNGKGGESIRKNGKNWIEEIDFIYYSPKVLLSFLQKKVMVRDFLVVDKIKSNYADNTKKINFGKKWKKRIILSDLGWINIGD